MYPSEIAFRDATSHGWMSDYKQIANINQAHAAELTAIYVRREVTTWEITNHPSHQVYTQVLS